MNKLKIFRFIILFGIISKSNNLICNDNVTSEDDIYGWKKQEVEDNQEEKTNRNMPTWAIVLICTLATMICLGIVAVICCFIAIPEFLGAFMFEPLNP